MDIRSALLQEHSKQQTLLIANYIGDDQERFDSLMELFFKEEYRLVQRAAWVVSHCAEQHLSLIMPHLPRMVAYLTKENVHTAVRRNLVKVLAGLDIPEDLMGAVADACFTFLANPKEQAAVRVYAMQVLYNLCQKELDLANELILLIEDALPHGSAAIRARGRKILKQLKGFD